CLARKRVGGLQAMVAGVVGIGSVALIFRRDSLCGLILFASLSVDSSAPTARLSAIPGHEQCDRERASYVCPRPLADGSVQRDVDSLLQRKQATVDAQSPGCRAPVVSGHSRILRSLRADTFERGTEQDHARNADVPLRVIHKKPRPCHEAFGGRERY